MNAPFQGGLTLAVSPTHTTLGHVVQGMEMKVVNVETRRICQENETGEIWARSNVEMKGYLNEPEEDEAFFAGDGWFRTGDLGHYDDDLVLHFDGRLKELVKVQGKHVYPTEVSD